MRAGRLNHRITILRNTPAQSTAGTPVASWATVATVYAGIRYQKGTEAAAAQQVVGKSLATFSIRWSSEVSDVNATDRIGHNGREYDIKDVREIGYREGIEIDAVARSEVGLLQRAALDFSQAWNSAWWIYGWA